MYMLRVFMLTFLGEPKDHHVHEHAHESAPVDDAAADPPRRARGRRRLRGLRGGRRGARLRHAASSATVEYVLADDPHEFHFDWPMAIISTVARRRRPRRLRWYAWQRRRRAGEGWQRRRSPFVYALFRNKFYIDDFYQWTINNVVLGVRARRRLLRPRVVNDTGVDGPGQVDEHRGLGPEVQQTGKLPNYALAMVARRGGAGDRRLLGEGVTWSRDTLLLALIAIPLLTAVALVFVPGEQKDLVR